MTLIMSNVIFVQTCHYSMCQKLFRCGARRRMAILESCTQLLAENINHEQDLSSSEGLARLVTGGD